MIFVDNKMYTFFPWSVAHTICGGSKNLFGFGEQIVFFSLPLLYIIAWVVTSAIQSHHTCVVTLSNVKVTYKSTHFVLLFCSVTLTIYHSMGSYKCHSESLEGWGRNGILREHVRVAYRRFFSDRGRICGNHKNNYVGTNFI